MTWLSLEFVMHSCVRLDTISFSVYDFQNIDCLDISLNISDAEESLLENIVYSTNQSLESQNTTCVNDDETYQEESSYDSDDD